MLPRHHHNRTLPAFGTTGRLPQIVAWQHQGLDDASAGWPIPVSQRRCQALGGTMRWVGVLPVMASMVAGAEPDSLPPRSPGDKDLTSL